MRMACKGLSCWMADPPARNLFIVIGFFTILNVAWKDSGDSGAESSQKHTFVNVERQVSRNEHKRMVVSDITVFFNII